MGSEWVKRGGVLVRPAGYIAPGGKTTVVKGNEGKQESGKLVGEHMVKMMCPQRLARTYSLSSCLSMWAPILLRQLRPQRLLRSSTNTSIKTPTVDSVLCFVSVLPLEFSCSPFHIQSRASWVSTKDIPQNGGKAIRVPPTPKERPFRFVVVALPGPKGKLNAEPPHLVHDPCT
jgi:hypothetical protein